MASKNIILWIAAFAALALPGAVHSIAAELEVSVSSQETQIGLPVILNVAIKDAKDIEPPAAPKIDNVLVREGGAPSNFTQIANVNGMVTTTRTLIYRYELTPLKNGEFTIPEISVVADGQTLKSKPVTVSVTKNDAGDLLFAEVTASRASLFVGESLTVTLKIYIKPLSEPRLGKAGAEAMFGQVNLEKSQWGDFDSELRTLAQQRRQPAGKEVLRKGTDGQQRAYYVYELEQTIWPQRSGPVSVGDIQIVMAYPQRIVENMDFFRRGFSFEGQRPLAVTPEVAAVDVKPLPTQDRPAIFRGAVGQFDVSATAKPTDVTAGDPITLDINIHGSGRLETLTPPPLAEMPELTGPFKVPTDPLAGVVANGQKTFTISIRARDDSVKEIPPIPFAYFDPVSEKYVTVKTEAIPLTVKPAQKMAITQIVASDAGKAGNATQLTESRGGLLANYVGDIVLRQQTIKVGWSMALLAGVPPVAFAAVLLARRRSERLANDTGYSRSRNARRAAMRRLKLAESASDQPAGVSAAVIHYVADRFNLPAGGLTRADVVRILQEHKLAEGVVQQVNSLLETCEQSRYAPEAGAAGSLAQAGQTCIEELEVAGSR